MQRSHLEEFIAYKPESAVKNKEEESVGLTDLGFQRVSTGARERYTKKHPKQVNFQNALINFMVLDGVHLNITTRRGFKDLVRVLDSKIRIPGRGKVMNMLNIRYEQVNN